MKPLRTFISLTFVRVRVNKEITALLIVLEKGTKSFYLCTR